MSAVSQADGEPPDSGHTPGTGILTAERAYLLQSREFLHLMREDVLSLKALGRSRLGGVPQGRAVPPGRGPQGPARYPAVLRPARLPCRRAARRGRAA
jgi:hypothetical protein